MNKEALTPLVIKAQAKDADALNELMTACYETLYYYAYNEVKDCDLAADITQESCLEIMSTLENLRKPEAFLRWAGRIVSHKCSRHYRQTQREAALYEDEDGETILDKLPDSSRGSLPEQVQEDKEFKRIMWEMLDSLPPEQRQALLLYYVEDFSVGQIAEMQDVPAGTVKSRLNYGRKAVISKVDAYEKKTGTKLHSLVPLPLLLYFLFGQNKAAVSKTAASALAKVASGISSTATAGSAAAGGASAAVGASLGAKLLAGVAAAAVALTCVAVIVPQVLPEKAPVEAQQTFSCAEYAGEWLCAVYDEQAGSIREETFVIYEEGILEVEGERYRLRPDSYNHYLFASPEALPLPQSEWYTEVDRFALSFTKHRDDYAARFFTVTAAGNGEVYMEDMGEGFRLSGFEGYTALRLTEENAADYLCINSLSTNIREEDGAWIVYHQGTLSCAAENGFYFARLQPVVELTLTESYLEYDESARSVTLVFETASPRTETEQVSLDSVVNFLHDDSVLTYELPDALTPTPYPNRYDGMYVTSAKLIGAAQVYGYVFLPNE